jgi:PIN domain nuclease of toxin-antitoxin system
MGAGVKVLLDTHVLLWWVEGDEKLSQRARNAIQDEDTTVVVSAVSAWEIAIKSHQGKLNAGPLAVDFRGELEQEGFDELPIYSHHAVRAGQLGGRHKDPFDRMLAAQAQAESLSIISKDKHFDQYGLRRIW